MHMSSEKNKNNQLHYFGSSELSTSKNTGQLSNASLG